MDRSQKADLVAELKDVFAETGVVVVTRNLGLTVAQSGDLRAKMRDAGAQFKVAKNRLAKIDLSEEERPHIDDEFEEITEGEEVDRKEALKSEWSTIETLVGTPRRLRLIAADLVEHFEKRQGTMEGKALVVCMSRRICAELYNQLKAIRPDWFDDDEPAPAGVADDFSDGYYDEEPTAADEAAAWPSPTQPTVPLTKPAGTPMDNYPLDEEVPDPAPPAKTRKKPRKEPALSLDRVVDGPYSLPPLDLLIAGDPPKRLTARMVAPCIANSNVDPYRNAIESAWNGL